MIETTERQMHLERRIVNWFYEGSVGISSKALAKALIYKEALELGDYPRDPADFIRCERMIRFIGLNKEFSSFRFNLASTIKGPWKKLLENWAQIWAEIEEEKATGKCPKAYETMRRLIKEGELDFE